MPPLPCRLGRRRFTASAIVVFTCALACGCGGGGGASPASFVSTGVPTPPASAPPTAAPTSPPAAPLTASASSDAFTLAGQSATVTLSEIAYAGPVTVDATACAGIATASPATRECAGGVHDHGAGQRIVHAILRGRVRTTRDGHGRRHDHAGSRAVSARPFACAAVAAMLTTTACAGASHVTPSAARGAAKARAPVNVTIRWPGRAGASGATRRPRFVSPSAVSVVVEVNPDSSPAGPITFANAPAGGGSSTVAIDAPVGPDVFVISVYDAAQSAGETAAAGNELGRVTVSQTVVSDTTNTLTATVVGTVAAIRIGPAANQTNVVPIPGSSPPAYELVGRAPATFTAAPLDADGNVIVQPDAPPSIALAPNVRSTGVLAVTAVAGQPNQFTVQAVAPNTTTYPTALAATASDANGNLATSSTIVDVTSALYVAYANGGSPAVARFEPHGTPMPLPAGAFAGLSNPVALAYDADDRTIFVADAGLGEVLAFDENGSPVASFAPQSLAGANGVTYDPNDRNVYATGTSGVVAFAPNGGPPNAGAPATFAAANAAGIAFVVANAGRAGRSPRGRQCVGVAGARVLRRERRRAKLRRADGRAERGRVRRADSERTVTADDGAALRHHGVRHRRVPAVRAEHRDGVGRRRPVRDRRRSELPRTGRDGALRRRDHQLSLRPERHRRGDVVRDSRRARSHAAARSVSCLLAPAPRSYSSRVLAIGASAADARPYRPAVSPKPMPYSTKVAFMGYLRDGRVVTVYADGRVRIAPPQQVGTAADRKTRMLAQLRAMRNPALRPVETRVSPQRYGSLNASVSTATRNRILFDLDRAPQPYVPGRVVVVLKNGVTMQQDHQALAPAATATLVRGVLARNKAMSPHPFTTDARMNQTLMQLGVDKADRLFAKLDRGTLASMRARAQARTAKTLLPIENAYVLHVSASSVEKAVRTLRASSSVQYAAPDRTVSSMIADPHPLPASVQTEIAGYRRATKTFGRSVKSTAASSLPTNAAVSFSLEAMLGATGVDAVAAFDEIQRQFGQLPGTGEIITNVGLGDVDDASTATNPNDPCQYYAQTYGPTTHLIGGQHYLDFPSMPLIPAWVSDPDGNLYAGGETCGVDPNLYEVGLDFSVMAPLPDAQQRAGETATLSEDLLGIAPGASYRWIAPGTTTGAVGGTDLAGALIGAARQVPAPNVITASIGWGADSYGFPGRYLEDDPLMQSVVASVVNSGIVVCIAANDGTRTIQLSAVGPSGGSAPTVAATSGFTNVDDLYYSTAASYDPDDGAFDVGASTLDDIFSANPQDATAGALGSQPSFAETRYNGTLGFSSGFGSRVNLSAPGDNIYALFKAGFNDDAAGADIVGGTSASAPEVAAAAAVAMQVATLTGHPLASPLAVRNLLATTGKPVANPPQADVALSVGPQVSVRRAVESLLAAAGKTVQPGIARVAVHGRRTGSFFADGYLYYDSVFVTALDPAYIKLDGPFSAPTDYVFPTTDTGAELHSYITIAPDWEAIPANATYRLTVAGQPGRIVSTAPYARMLPAQLFAATGVPLAPGTSRTISLTYSASVGLHVVAESTFQLTFGPPAPASRLVLAPVVPASVSGSSIPVTYDLRGYPAGLPQNPTLNVSVPGNGIDWLPYADGIYPYYSTPLTSSHGTVNVPVSALPGAGTYTLWIDMQTQTGAYDASDVAFTRVDAGTARPPAPALSAAPGQNAAHFLAVPYKSTFTVTYDVSSVPRATGAIVEIAAPPPGAPFYGSGGKSGLNTFRNPNGSELDDDGVVTGSIYHVSASGTTGSVTIDPTVAGIPATTTANVRVIPTSGGTPIAEASDVDTVQYLGIEPLLGGTLSAAYLNPNGTDGYFVEGGGVGTAQASFAFNAYEPFDLASGNGAVSGVSSAFEGFSVFLPVVQTDSGLVANSADYLNVTYFLADPLAAGFTQASLPSAAFGASMLMQSAAVNSSPTRSAYAGVNLNTGSLIAVAGDVTSGAFSTPVDITSVLGPNFDFGGLFQIAYDPTTDRGYVLNEDSTQPCAQQAMQLVTIDFTAGTASSTTLPIDAGEAFPENGYGIAIDPNTDTAAVATSCKITGANLVNTFRAELALINLASGTTTRVFQHTTDLAHDIHGFPRMMRRRLAGDRHRYRQPRAAAAVDLVSDRHVAVRHQRSPLPERVHRVGNARENDPEPLHRRRRDDQQRLSVRRHEQLDTNERRGGTRAGHVRSRELGPPAVRVLGMGVGGVLERSSPLEHATAWSERPEQPVRLARELTVARVHVCRHAADRVVDAEVQDVVRRMRDAEREVARRGAQVARSVVLQRDGGRHAEKRPRPDCVAGSGICTARCDRRRRVDEAADSGWDRRCPDHAVRRVLVLDVEVHREVCRRGLARGGGESAGGHESREREGFEATDHELVSCSNAPRGADGRRSRGRRRRAAVSAARSSLVRARSLHRERDREVAFGFVRRRGACRARHLARPRRARVRREDEASSVVRERVAERALARRVGRCAIDQRARDRARADRRHGVRVGRAARHERQWGIVRCDVTAERRRARRVDEVESRRRVRHAHTRGGIRRGRTTRRRRNGEDCQRPRLA